MKKKIFLSLFIIMLLFSFITRAKAISFSESRHLESENIIETDGNLSPNCGGVFTPEALDLISEVLGYFRILAPAVLILMIAIDFSSAVIGQYSPKEKQDEMQIATSKIVKRSLAAIGLFLVPTIVRLLINLPGVRDAIQISDDPLCNTLNGIVERVEV